MPRTQLPDGSWETIADPEDPEDINRRSAVVSLLGASVFDEASTLTNVEIIRVLKLIIRHLIKRGFLN